VASRFVSASIEPSAVPAAPAPAPAIQLSNVTRVFGVTPALVRVDLRVERGEVVLVRGSNGAGKSTLLRVLATLLSPTYGSGSVLGLDLARDRQAIRARVELLGHRTRLYEDLTAAENLLFACRLFGLAPDGVAAALRAVGLDGVAATRVRAFSAGMRQRVAVARTMLRSPELLLLDEPYAGLDTEAREAVDGLVRDAASRGATVLLATHEPTRGGLAGRTIFMEAGQILPGGVPG
jgi:heme ABC exporter ATP-binding subunit CcmA